MSHAIRVFAAALLFAVSFCSHALNILLTNDDGWNAPGIEAVRSALVAAGHNVTLVGPLVNHSGGGGQTNTQFGATVAVVQQSPKIWSVASTPSDAVRAALGGVLTAAEVAALDLVVSGTNEGQNMGMTGSWQSGTFNAALLGLSYGVPTIAVSTERLFSPSNADTIAAMPATAAFMVKLVDRLQQTAMGGKLLPLRTLLNVTYPVFNATFKPGPVQSVQGVRVTNLATKNNIEFVWSGNPAVTGTMDIGIDFAQFTSTAPDPIPNSDRDAVRAGFISITPIDGDMTAKRAASTVFDAIQWRLNGLTP